VNYQEFAAARDGGFDDDPQCHCPACGEGRHFAEEMSETFDALERARVVGVLDAWADKVCGTVQLDCEEVPEAFGKMTGTPSGQRLGVACQLIAKTGKILRIERGATANAARAAAAKAIEAGEVE